MQGLTFTIKQRKHWFFDAFVLRFRYRFALYATLVAVACCTVCFATSVVVDKLGTVCLATGAAVDKLGSDCLTGVITVRPAAVGLLVRAWFVLLVRGCCASCKPSFLLPCQCL